jgi:PAS domain S-box-containing protein
MPYWIVTLFQILSRIMEDGGWAGLLSWLFRRGPKGLRVASVVFLAISIAASFWWWWGTKDVQYLFAQTLSTPLEATAQSYKGLEAFALAGLDESVKESFKDVKVTPGFAQLSQQFDNALSMGAKAMPPLRVMPAAGLSLAQTYISDSLASDGEHGFLFVPAMILRVSPTTARPTEEQIKLAAARDPELSVEIRASAAVAATICDFEKTPIFSDVPALFHDARDVTPVQSYFLTSIGLMRVCEHNINNQELYYTRQFLPNTFFPDRPYFLATINQFPVPTPAQSGPLAQSLWITKPYIDLGGNGVVVTMCRRTKAPWPTESALFLDVSLGTAAAEFITTKVEKFGGRATPITCALSPNISCGGELSLGERDSLNNEISTISPQSEIFGKIHVFKYSHLPQQIIFTIPLSRDLARPGTQYVLLYCTIDLQKLRFWNAAKASVAGGSFLLFLFLVGAVIADFGLQLRGQDRAFTTLGKVMGQAPVAYCRLDDQDRFLDMNEAFVKMLGYQSEEQLKKESKKFADLLADDESRLKYEQIQKLRVGEESEFAKPESYRLLMRKAGHSETKSVFVYGGSVPAPKSGRHKMPQTFGILMEIYGAAPPPAPLDLTSSGADISGDWKYKCEAPNYAHGGALKIEMQNTTYGPQWRLVGTREWREMNGKRENIKYVWSTDWAAFTEKDRIKYTYKITTDRGIVLGYADGAVTKRKGDRPVEISGAFYQLPPLDAMYGNYEFRRD